MDTYLCQSCNKIVISYENHACFLRKNYDNEFTQRRQHELYEKDAKNDEVNSGCTANSSDNSKQFCPVFQQTDAGNSEKINCLPTEKNEQGSFIYHLKRKRTFSSLPAEKPVEAQPGNLPEYLRNSSTLNIRSNKVHSNENPVLKSSPPFEPGSVSGKRFCMDYKSKASAPEGLYAQNKCESTHSTSNHEDFSEGYQILLKERILQYFTGDKMLSMESFGTRQSVPSQSENTPETANVLFRCASTSGNNETDKDAFEELGHLLDSSISDKVSSPMLGKCDGVTVNMKQKLNSLKVRVSALAGPCGIRNKCLLEAKNQFTCDICHKTIERKSDFDKHYRIHTGEKPFQCDICGKRFSVKNNLTTHDRTHTGEKPFQCDICKRRFSRKQHLATHSRTHTGEKSYVCAVCDKSFAEKRTLNTHYRTHTGEKPYVCDRCQKCFADRTSFRRHAKTHSRKDS